MAKRAKPLYLGGFTKDEFVEVGPDGFTIGAPSAREGGPRRSNHVPRPLAWDAIASLDARLVKSGWRDFGSMFLNVATVRSSTIQVNLRGYLQLMFTLVDDPSRPMVVEIPRSMRWNPDGRWVREFVTRVNEAIADPEQRARFVR